MEEAWKQWPQVTWIQYSEERVPSTSNIIFQGNKFWDVIEWIVKKDMLKSMNEEEDWSILKDTIIKVQ